jgi:hypothetical protein
MMANNRLYLIDDETGESCLLAKGWGSGWVLWFHEEIEAWLRDRDLAASVGNGPTKIRLVTEDALPPTPPP